jgi:hypothetical protein
MATVGATTYLSSLNLALVQASRAGLEEEFEARGILARGRWLLDRMMEASHAVALFRTVGRVTTFSLVLVLFEGFGDAARITVTGLVGTALVSVALIWLFTSVLSSAIARHATYAVIASSLGFIETTLVVVGPLLAAVGFIDEVVRRLTGANLREDETEEELLHSIEDHKREGEIDPVAATLLQRAVVFGQTTVASVMTPRTDVEAIELTADFGAVREQVAAIRHSRIPVYEESLDTIVGILHVRDLVPYFGQNADGLALRALLRDPALGRTAVIINEFGEIGIDHDLIETSDEDFIALTTGCLCCKVRSDLVITLRDLADRRERGELPAFERVVIETSGLADPAAILQALMVDRELASIYTLSQVITTADATLGLETLDRHPQSRRHGGGDRAFSCREGPGLFVPLQGLERFRCRRSGDGADHSDRLADRQALQPLWL